MQDFAMDMSGAKRLGVAFERSHNAVGHAVVYELVSPSVSLKASDEHRKVANAAKRSERRPVWRYVDYQADANGKDVTGDVEKWFPKIIFAVEAEGANFARTAIFTSDDRRRQMTADGVLRAEKDRKIARAKLLQQRRGGYSSESDGDAMDIDA